MDDYSTINFTNIGENSSKCDSPTQNRASALIAGLSLIEKNACKTPPAAATVLSQKRRAVALGRPDDFLAAGDSVDDDDGDGGDQKVEREFFIKRFKLMNETQQDYLMKCFLTNMNHVQLSRLNEFLSPMLQRDFIDLLIGKSLHQIVDHIFSFLDAQSLCKVEVVSGRWRRALAGGLTWKKSVERKVCTDRVWSGLSVIRDWRKYLFKQKSYPPDPHLFYKLLFAKVSREIANLQRNWTTDGRRYVLKRIDCRSEASKGVYCIQYDDDKIVAGLRDDSIRIWDKNTLQCRKVIVGHSGSVLCLQYDDRVIISGSSDATVRVWDVNSGEMLQIFDQHKEAVLHLKFANGTMVTCSKDKTVAVWDMQSPTRIVVRKVLFGHRAAVNVVDFDDKYIVSASGDRTIQVWCMQTFSFVRTLNGHRRGIACLQYKNGLVISGSSDFSLRIWDVELGVCLRVLEGHKDLIRCLRFDDKRIISGSYDGAIKIWNLEAALNPKCPSSTLCVKTLTEHTGRVFRLQFDDFQLVSSSHDDSILIWDFLNFGRPEQEEGGGVVATV